MIAQPLRIETTFQGRLNPLFKKPDKSGIGFANRVMLRTGYFGRRKGYLRANILNNASLLAMLRACINNHWKNSLVQI